MSNPTRLELSSLPQRHPRVGAALLHRYGPDAVVRLSTEPIALPHGVEERAVGVGHTPRGQTTARHVYVVIDWTGLFPSVVLEQMPRTPPALDLSEGGAVCVAALLVSHFEEGSFLNVLEIGSGGDYEVEVKWRKRPVQLEVSGLLRDDTPSGAEVRKRVTQKRQQVRDGFVSVTAFYHQATNGPYSVLCFESPRRTSPKRKGKRR